MDDAGRPIGPMGLHAEKASKRPGDTHAPSTRKDHAPRDVDRARKARGTPEERGQKSEKDPTARLSGNLPLDDPRRCFATNGIGERCRQLAVKGGKTCRYHGGAVKKNKHGEFKYVLKGRLKDVIEKYAADPEPKKLRDEVAVARAILQDQLELLDSGKDEASRLSALAESLQRSLACISGLVAALAKLEDGERYTLDMGQAEELVAHVVRAVAENVKDQKTRDAIAAAIMAAPVLEKVDAASKAKGGGE